MAAMRGALGVLVGVAYLIRLSPFPTLLIVRMRYARPGGAADVMDGWPDPGAGWRSWLIILVRWTLPYLIAGYLVAAVGRTRARALSFAPLAAVVALAAVAVATRLPAASEALGTGEMIGPGLATAGLWAICLASTWAGAALASWRRGEPAAHKAHAWVTGVLILCLLAVLIPAPSRGDGGRVHRLIAAPDGGVALVSWGPVGVLGLGFHNRVIALYALEYLLLGLIAGAAWGTSSLALAPCGIVLARLLDWRDMGLATWGASPALLKLVGIALAAAVIGALLGNAARAWLGGKRAPQDRPGRSQRPAENRHDRARHSRVRDRRPRR